jgi:hypothetical protein
VLAGVLDVVARHNLLACGDCRYMNTSDYFQASLESRKSVAATYRVQRFPRRQLDASAAALAERMQAGLAVKGYSPTSRASDAVDHLEETVSVWRQHNATRVEIHGGARDGLVAVSAGGETRWLDPSSGRVRRVGGASGGSGTNGIYGFLLNPSWLPSSLDFAVVGEEMWVAQRRAVLARAVPRPYSERSRILELESVGAGADRFVMAVDAECGLLLVCRAFKSDEVLQDIVATAVAVDGLVDPAMFSFAALDPA